MRKSYFVSIIAILCLTVLISCDNNKNSTSNDTTTIVGSGTITTESRTLPTFHSVLLAGTGDIHISAGAEQSIVVDADDNIHEYILMSVEDGVLVIETQEHISFSNVSIDYTLTMTDLENISIVGAGNVMVSPVFEADMVSLDLIGAGNFNVNLDVSTLNTNLIGAGNFNIAGTSDSHNILLSGTGTINAYGLDNAAANITISGTGNCLVYVSDNLNVTITGIGSVYYQGTPSVSATITGIGNVVHATK